MKASHSSVAKSKGYASSSVDWQNTVSSNRMQQGARHKILPLAENDRIKNQFKSNDVNDIQTSSDDQETVDSLVNQLLSYSFALCSKHRLWRDVNDLMTVRDGIYDSVCFENSLEYSKFCKKAYLKESTKQSQSKFHMSCKKLSQWKHSLALFEEDCSKPICPLSLIFNAHFTALESICSALIETVKSASSSNSNHSLLYSLYSIAVIHFCNACESFRHLNGKEVEKENAWPQSKNAISALQKYAQIFNFPNWIINCRNNLAHSSSRPPTLNFLHMAVTFALECMDRYFLSPLLLDACRVDPDYSVNGEKSKSENGFCSQCKWQSLSTMPPMKMQRPHLLENPSQSCSNQDVEKNTQGQKRRLNRSHTPIHSKRQKNSRFYN